MNPRKPITFGQKRTMADHYAVADALLGKHTGVSKGSKPPPKPKITMRPTGGLKPDGFKAKVEWKF